MTFKMNIYRVRRYCLARRKLLRILCGFLIVGALYGMVRSNSRNPQERIAHDAGQINQFTGVGEVLDRVDTEMVRNQQKTTTITTTTRITTTTNHSITEKMDKHSWSILDQLDQAKISYSFGAKRFDGLRTLEWNDCVDEGFRDSRLPPTDPGESFTWQHIDPEDNDIYLFSAFFDVRSTPPQVTVLGIARNYFFRRRILCRVWYRGQSEPDVVESSYAFSPETHALRYAATFYMCPVRRRLSVPYSVSLISSECRPANNFLNVVNFNLSSQPEVNFTVCFAPLNRNYDNQYQLIETVELNRMFGAQRFVIYNYSTGSHVTEFINSYKYEGIVDVIPWKIPVKVDAEKGKEPEIHYYGQVSALNDCIFRNLRRSRFIVISDLDEIIVPRKHNNWNELLETVTKDWVKIWRAKTGLFPGAYVVRSSFFRSDWGDDDRMNSNKQVRDLRLKSLLTTNREEHVFPHNTRSKYIVWSKAVMIAGVHFVNQFVDDFTIRSVNLGPDAALVHHYRPEMWPDNPDNPPIRVRDRHMHRYADEIRKRVAARHEKVKT